MNFSEIALWIGIVIVTFFVFYIVATLLRNSAAKKDRIGRSESDTVTDSVSVNPRKNTRKLE